MTTVSVTEARKDLYKLVSEVSKGFYPVNIKNKNGDSVVLLSESEWRSIEETIYLTSIPGFVESVKEALKEDRSKATVFEEGEEW